jgi:membrane protein YqaA with SNARE-associated domain
MLGSILSIVASVGGMVATWYIGRAALRWLQRYYTWRDTQKIEELKKQEQDQSQKADAEKKKQDQAEAEFEKQ